MRGFIKAFGKLKPTCKAIFAIAKHPLAWAICAVIFLIIMFVR